MAKLADERTRERADSAVELTPETLHRWLEEESRSLRREAAFYKAFAQFRQFN